MSEKERAKRPNEFVSMTARKEDKDESQGIRLDKSPIFCLKRPAKGQRPQTK